MIPLATISRGLVSGLALALFLGAACAGYSQQAAPAAPQIMLEDFENATLGSKPYLWKEQKQNADEAAITAVFSEMEGNDANKALKIEYAFAAAFDATHGVDAGPMGQPLPGSLAAVDVLVHGDASKNAVALRLRDRLGELFEYRVPVTWEGWKKVRFPLSRPAFSSGSQRNGRLDLPLTFQSVRVARLNGGARKGELLFDQIAAVCAFPRVVTLYDVADGVKPETWKANRNHATIGLLADSIVRRDGKEIPVLKMEYEYESAEDASVEYTRILPAGNGHGTLIAEVFGDGSNNLLRFRMQDGADRIWQADASHILVDWTGWKTLYLDTRTLKDPQALDPTATVEKFPVKFYSLLIDDCSAKDMLPGVESGRKGEIFLGRILFCPEK